VWSAVDVIKAAGYPVEVYTSCKTDDGYLMEIVRIMRPGERLLWWGQGLGFIARLRVRTT